jgi:hypothetical protein
MNNHTSRSRGRYPKTEGDYHLRSHLNSTQTAEFSWIGLCSGMRGSVILLLYSVSCRVWYQYLFSSPYLQYTPCTNLDPPGFVEWLSLLKLSNWFVPIGAYFPLPRDVRTERYKLLHFVLQGVRPTKVHSLDNKEHNRMQRFILPFSGRGVASRTGSILISVQRILPHRGLSVL